MNTMLTAGQYQFVMLLLILLAAAILYMLADFRRGRRKADQAMREERGKVGGIDSSPSPYWRNSAAKTGFTAEQLSKAAEHQLGACLAESPWVAGKPYKPGDRITITEDDFGLEMTAQGEKMLNEIAGHAWIADNLGDVPYRHTFLGTPVEWGERPTWRGMPIHAERDE